MRDSNKKYNETIAPCYRTKNGFWSLQINSEIFDKLQTIKEGGRLVVKVVDEKYRKHERSPEAYIEYMTPDQVEEFKTKRPGGSSSSDMRASAPASDDLDI